MDRIYAGVILEIWILEIGLLSYIPEQSRFQPGEKGDNHEKKKLLHRKPFTKFQNYKNILLGNSVL